MMLAKNSTPPDQGLLKTNIGEQPFVLPKPICFEFNRRNAKPESVALLAPETLGQMILPECLDPSQVFCTVV